MNISYGYKTTYYTLYKYTQSNTLYHQTLVQRNVSEINEDIKVYIKFHIDVDGKRI